MKKHLMTLVAAPAVLAAVVAAPAHATNDPRWGQQYGPQQIGAPTAWSKSKGTGVRIAVIDSGVDLQHPDLKAQIVEGCPGPNCYDFGDGDNNPDDDSNVRDGNNQPVRGHGTHVAGIAAAATDNGEGIAGVAPEAKIMPLKVFGNGGSLTGIISDVPDAVDFAVSHGAKVLNLSLGDFNLPGGVGPIQTACNSAFDEGALCIVSSGNERDRKRESGYDNAFKGLIVTANDDKGNHASFAQNADTQWALSAPGVGIMSAVPVEDGSYGGKSGTSMAAPHAAGVAALLFSQGKSNRQVVEQMITTASPARDRAVSGYGILNAAAAVGASAPPSGSQAAKSGGVAGGAASTGGSSAKKPSGGSSSGGEQGSEGGDGALGSGEQGGGGDDFTSGFADESDETTDIDGQATGSTSDGSPVTGDAAAKTVAALLLAVVGLSTFGAWRRRPV